VSARPEVSAESIAWSTEWPLNNVRTKTSNETSSRPDWTPREWTVAASKPADFTDAAPIDLSKVQAQRRPRVQPNRAKVQTPRMRLFVLAAAVLFLAALTIAVLAATGIL